MCTNPEEKTGPARECAGPAKCSVAPPRGSGARERPAKLRGGRAWSGRGSREMVLQLRLVFALWVRAEDRVDHLAVLEEQHERDRANIEANRRLLIRVDIHLRHLHLAGVLLRQIVEHRTDHPTGTAPGCPEIDDDEPVALFYFLLESGVRYCQRVQHLHPPQRASRERCPTLNCALTPVVERDSHATQHSSWST